MCRTAIEKGATVTTQDSDSFLRSSRTHGQNLLMHFMAVIHEGLYEIGVDIGGQILNGPLLYIKERKYGSDG